MDNIYTKILSKTDTNESNILASKVDINSNSKTKENIKIILSIFFYFMMFFLMIYIFKYNGSFELIFFGLQIKGTVLNIIISQIQVMICIYLSRNEKNKGFMIAILLNGCSILFTFMEMFINGNLHAVSSAIIYVFTVIIIKIINLNSKRLKIIKCEMLRQNKKLCEYEKQRNHLMFYDSLTNLPNRKMIIDRLDYIINNSINEIMSFAVVFIDLDNFKKINDTMGHLVGDLLLLTVADKINGQIHQKDILGRLEGDEFVLIIQRDLPEKVILKFIENIRDLFLDSFMINNIKLNVSASFGISIFPQDGNNASELLKYSSIAMNNAKDFGKNCIRFFNKAMNEEVISKIEFENNLRTSIQNNELFLVFQPQFSSKLKQLRGFEVLVRWKSKQFGFLNPAEFIPLAEELGYIVTMGEWTIRNTCNILKYIQDTFNINLAMSVNISAVQFMEPNFLHMVKNIIDETEVDSKNLEFEITESVFISSIDYVANILQELKNMGIGIALDDFGTGYSSLSYLQTLPINTLKIDKSFIDMIDKNSTQRHIAASIISLVHQMGIAVVAEGVENEIQIEYLKKHSCDYIQCFLWGKPIDIESVYKMLEECVS